jgi:hypothetical protein
MGELVDTFFVDADGIIEVLKRNSRLYTARHLLELVDVHKKPAAAKTVPSASTQTQIP